MTRFFKTSRYRWQKKYCNKMDEARPGHLKIWDIWDRRNSQKYKISKSKSVLPKMLARSGLVGKNSSWPQLGPSLAIFCVGRKNRKNTYFLLIFLGGPMGPIHPVWGNGCNISSATRTLSTCLTSSLASLAL